MIMMMKKGRGSGVTRVEFWMKEVENKNMDKKEGGELCWKNQEGC